MIRSVTVEKRPGEKIDQGWDWGPWLQSAVNPSEIITSCVHTAEGVELVGENHDNTTSVFRVQGGVVDVEATVTTTVTTTSGEVGIGIHYFTIRS